MSFERAPSNDKINTQRFVHDLITDAPDGSHIASYLLIENDEADADFVVSGSFDADRNVIISELEVRRLALIRALADKGIKGLVPQGIADGWTPELPQASK